MELVFYNTFSKREEFELTEGKRPWDIILILFDGSFSITFPRLKRSYTVQKNEGIFIPANEKFERHALAPIGFHQFAFLPPTDHLFYPDLCAGKLLAPPLQIAALSSAMNRVAIIPDNRELILHHLEHLLTLQHLFREHDRYNPKRFSRDMIVVLQYMNDHLADKITITELADLVHLSHTGLLWKFRHQLETTPSQYLIMLRMRYAKQLLLEGNLRINEIATRCGYTSAYYFTNAFRKEYGMNPSEFRRKHTKN